MAEINNVIAEASQDLQTIEDFVNLPAGSDVRPRLLPSVNVGTLAGTRQAIFEAGGLPAEPFETKANMETDGTSLPDGQLAMVHNETANNGLYVKVAGAWVKSAYDPLGQARQYADSLKDTTDFISSELKTIDPSKNLYITTADRQGFYINAVSGAIKALAGTAMSTLPVTEGDKIAFSTTATADVFAVIFSNTATPLSTYTLATQDRSIEGLVRVTVPVGFTYVHFNVLLTSGFDIRSTLIVNKGEYELYKYADKSIRDDTARQELKKSLKVTDLKSESYTEPNILDLGAKHPTFYLNTAAGTLSSLRADKGQAELWSFPVVAGQTYSIYSKDEKMKSLGISLSDSGFASGKVTTIIALSDTSIPEVKLFTVPAGMNFAFITVMLSTQDYDVRDNVWVSLGATVSKIPPKSLAKIAGFNLYDKLAHERIDDIAGSASNLIGAKYTSFGDSITWYNGKAFNDNHKEFGAVAKGYQAYVVDSLKAVLDNQGVSSIDLTQIYATKIQPYDFADTYITTIMSGANDARKGVAVGVVEPIGSTFNTTTYAGALQAAIEHIIASNPKTIIVLITPIRGWYTEYNTGNVPSKDPLTVGVMQRKYPDMVKAVAVLYGLPVVDFYDNLGWNDLNKNYYLGDDPVLFNAYLLHPNNLGFKRMGEMLVDAIKKY